MIINSFPKIVKNILGGLLLQLVSVPKEWGEKMLDKFRYVSLRDATRTGLYVSTNKLCSLDGRYYEMLTFLPLIRLLYLNM
jgi:hypothetical protein